ncbi:hypothetical protein CC79DRAFT_1369872 [Sarocladium strictum]
MACGHELTSFVCDPNKPHHEPCKTPRQRYFYDTCAECDPDHARKIARREYERRHALLMTLYLKAKAEDNHEQMTSLEQAMTEAVQQLRQDNFNIGLTRRGPIVLWPDIEE